MMGTEKQGPVYKAHAKDMKNVGKTEFGSADFMGKGNVIKSKALPKYSTGVPDGFEKEPRAGKTDLGNPLQKLGKGGSGHGVGGSLKVQRRRNPYG